MRYIINADDFGLHESCSRAIAEAFSLNLITDTTACANGEFLEYAIQLANNEGFADRIGIHFNITTGKPLTEAIKKCDVFCDATGVFYRDQNRYGLLNKEQKELLYLELMAQYERLSACGINITHADSHHHIHTAPIYYSVFNRVFKDCGIKKVRLLRNIRVNNPMRLCMIHTINRLYIKKGRITTDCFAGASDYFKCPDLNKDGISEIMVHPDYDYESGILIDRVKYVDGKPYGKSFDALKNFLKEKQNDMQSYVDLS